MQHGTFHRNPWRLAAALLLLSGLGGCFTGGGDDDPVVVNPPPVASEIPDSALASADAYTRFALALAPSDSTEPLNVDKVLNPPVSDDTEPLSVD